VHGANLPARIGVRDVDFGPGVRVTGGQPGLAGADGAARGCDEEAPLGARDLYLGGVPLADAVAVYDRVHTIRVLPRAGHGACRRRAAAEDAAAVRGGGVPQRAGRAAGHRRRCAARPRPVTWSIEEYPVTHDDDDIHFIGTIDANGLFTPALDGPNPERSGNRNNIGDAYVVASYTPPDAPAGTPAAARPCAPARDRAELHALGSLADERREPRAHHGRGRQSRQRGAASPRGGDGDEPGSYMLREFHAVRSGRRTLPVPRAERRGRAPR
jgi:quinohemoprotein amine dehydrogenase